MSHQLVMTIKNNSTQVIQFVSVTHSWDGNTDTLPVNNLAAGATSDGINITTGYGENDDYTVSAVFQDGTKFNTNFYCNSSHNQTGVRIEITKSYCNCVYTDVNGDAASCNNKG